jgi:hypothetical protein
MICQHSFCRLCIKSYIKTQSNTDIGDDGFQIYRSNKDKMPKCPVCRSAIFLPINDNIVLKEIIEKKYPEKYKERLDNFHIKGLLKLDIKDQIEDEIRQEIQTAILTEIGINNIPTNPRETPRFSNIDTRDITIYAKKSLLKRIFINEVGLCLAFCLILNITAIIMFKLDASTPTLALTLTCIGGIYAYLAAVYF